jgi:hypothetical protein
MTIDEFKPTATKRCGEDTLERCLRAFVSTENQARKEPWLKLT